MYTIVIGIAEVGWEHSAGPKAYLPTEEIVDRGVYHTIEEARNALWKVAALAASGVKIRVTVRMHDNYNSIDTTAPKGIEISVIVSDEREKDA